MRGPAPGGIDLCASAFPVGVRVRRSTSVSLAGRCEAVGLSCNTYVHTKFSELTPPVSGTP